MHLWKLWAWNVTAHVFCFGEISSWKLMISFVGDFPWINKHLRLWTCQHLSPLDFIISLVPSPIYASLPAWVASLSWLLLPRNQASWPGNWTGQTASVLLHALGCVQTELFIGMPWPLLWTLLLKVGTRAGNLRFPSQPPGNAVQWTMFRKLKAGFRICVVVLD